MFQGPQFRNIFPLNKHCVFCPCRENPLASEQKSRNTTIYPGRHKQVEAFWFNAAYSPMHLIRIIQRWQCWSSRLSVTPCIQRHIKLSRNPPEIQWKYWGKE